MKRRFLALLVVLAVTTLVMSSYAQSRRSLRPEKAKDPVCGLMVEKDPKLSANYKGEVFYFCSRTDLDQFRKNPDRYVKK